MAADGDVVKGPSHREQESAKSISVQTGTLHLCHYSQTESGRRNIGSSLNQPTGRLAQTTTDDLVRTYQREECLRVKVFEAGALWWLYVSYDWSHPHLT